MDTPMFAQDQADCVSPAYTLDLVRGWSETPIKTCKTLPQPGTPATSPLDFEGMQSVDTTLSNSDKPQVPCVRRGRQRSAETEDVVPGPTTPLLQPVAKRRTR